MHRKSDSYAKRTTESNKVSRLERLYFFHGCHVSEHVLLSTYGNFRLFAFLLKSFSVDKCINKPFNNKVCSGLDGERSVYVHSVEEKASTE